MTGAHRWCPSCKDTMPLTAENFYPSPTCVGGFTPKCRGCTNIAKRESFRKWVEKRTAERKQKAADAGR